jgi:hypothetical protein
MVHDMREYAEDAIMPLLPQDKLLTAHEGRRMSFYRLAFLKKERRFHIVPTGHPAFNDFTGAKEEAMGKNATLSPNDVRERWMSLKPLAKKYYQTVNTVTLREIVRSSEAWLLECLVPIDDEQYFAFVEADKLIGLGGNNSHEYVPEGFPTVSLFEEYEEGRHIPELDGLDYRCGPDQA